MAQRIAAASYERRGVVTIPQRGRDETSDGQIALTVGAGMPIFSLAYDFPQRDHAMGREVRHDDDGVYCLIEDVDLSTDGVRI